jgi:type II secretory pathway pseudopilin PulG
MLVGITVKSEDFQHLSLGRVLLRETIGKFVSEIILCIGYIMAGFTAKKQGLHDKFARTVVIYKDPAQSHRVGLIVGIVIAAILPIIAIIGILASVVLVSLNTARTKAQDARVMSDLNDIRVSAEIYSGNNNESYSHAKDCSSGLFADQTVQQIISSLPDNKMTCYAEGTSYAVSAQLHNPDMNYCVDSTGYDGNAVAVDTDSQASCQAAPATAADQTASENNASSTLYAYTLPSGWQYIPNNGEGEQASNKIAGFALSIVTVPLPAGVSSTSTIDQVVSQSDMSQVIQSEFPNATVGSVSSGSLDGEKAIISKFTATVVETASNGSQEQSKPLSIAQYNAIHKGISYTIVLINGSKAQSPEPADFQTIVNSFVFKQ